MSNVWQKGVWTDQGEQYYPLRTQQQLKRKGELPLFDAQGDAARFHHCAGNIKRFSQGSTAAALPPLLHPRQPCLALSVTHYEADHYEANHCRRT